MTHEMIPAMGTLTYCEPIAIAPYVEVVDTFHPATRVFALDWSDGPLEIIELVLPETADGDADG